MNSHRFVRLARGVYYGTLAVVSLLAVLGIVITFGWLAQTLGWPPQMGAGFFALLCVFGLFFCYGASK